MLYFIFQDSKWILLLWLWMSIIRSLIINIIILLTGLWIGYIVNSNKWIIFDFFSFKIFQIG